MIKSLKLFFKNYINFSGRATRSEYWFMYLWEMIGAILFFIIIGIIFAGTLAVSSKIDSKTLAPSLAIQLLFIFMMLYLIAVCALFIGNLSLMIRRLHDIGYSGLWVLFGFVPFVGGIVLLVFALLPSQMVDNQYGRYELFEYKEVK